MLPSFWIASSQAVAITGAGASFPNRLYQDAIFAYSFVNRDVKASYTSMGSGKGQCRIKDHSSECDASDDLLPLVLSWAGSDSLLDDSDYAKYPDLQMYPTVAGAVVPIYNLPHDTPGYSPLILSTTAIAHIFSGVITRWGHPALVQLNPWLTNMPSPNASIQVVVREDNSGSTDMFKKALSAFDVSFSSQIGPGSSAEWAGVAVIKRDTNYGVTTYVKETAYSLGYSVLAEALALNVPQAHLKKPAGAVVEASVQSVAFAVAERGLDFGNNGDPADRLTADIENAKGSLAWPIAGYTYLVMRKSARGDPNCDSRLATVNFFDWFYTSDVIQELAARNGFASLPSAVSNVILNRFRNDILCNRTIVYQPPPKVNLKFVGSDFMSSITYYISVAYRQIDSSVHFMFTSSASNASIVDRLAASSLTGSSKAPDTSVVLTSQSRPANEEGMIQIPIAGVAIAIAYSDCVTQNDACNRQLVFDLPTLAALVDGEITNWGDPALSTLNPWLKEAGVSLVLNETTPMRLFAESPSSETMQLLKTVLAQVKPSVSLAAFDGSSSVGLILPSAADVQSATTVQLGSLGITLRIGTVHRHLSMAAVRQPSTGNDIKPETHSILACGDGYSGNLYDSDHANCYPLSFSVNMLARRTYTDVECAGSSPRPLRLARMLEWLLSGNENAPIVTPLETNNLAPLLILTSHSLIKETLLSLTCNGTSMLRLDVHFNFLPDSVRYSGLASVYVSMAIGLGLAVWVLMYRSEKVLKAAQPEFLLLTIIGTWISLSAIIPASDDHQFVSPQSDTQPGERGRYPSLDFACNMQVVCYTLGFATTFGALFAKLWRVVKILINPEYKRLKVTIREMMGKVFALLAVELVILTAMIANKSSRMYYTVQITRRDSEGRELESHGLCTANNAWPFVIPLVAIHVGALIFGNYLCYKSRKVQSEYNEGKYLAFALANTLQIHIVAIMLALFVYDKVIPFFIIKWLAIMASSVGTLGLMFIPRIVAVHKKNVDNERAGVWIFVRKSFGAHRSQPNSSDRKYSSDDRNSEAERKEDHSEGVQQPHMEVSRKF